MKAKLGDSVVTTMGCRRSGKVIDPIPKDQYTDGSYREPTEEEKDVGITYICYADGTQGWQHDCYLALANHEQQVWGIMEHDRNSIRQLVLTNDRAVERAILAIYARQTASEQSSECTRESNGMGFNAFDAKSGTYYARWIQSGRRLSGVYLQKARRMAIRYIGQLVEIAQTRAKAA